jgi:uncharacterized protein (DUF362 family)
MLPVRPCVLSRRRFLASLAALTAGVVAGCVPASRTKAPPTMGGAASKPAGGASQGKPIVAIARCKDYGVQTVEAVVRDLVAQCGGMQEIVKPGATVVIKPNFTAGGFTATLDGLPPILSYTTHPDVTRAVALLAKEAGAGKVILVEGWGPKVWEVNQYQGWIKELGVETVNLDDPAPAADFAKVTVKDALELKTVLLHEAIAKADVFISVPKMKCHVSAGITLSIKNIFGCTPLPRYRENANDQYRSTMHKGKWSERLPRILVDILKARPIDLAVVDAISTIDQGEGPWNNTVPGVRIRTVRPELLMVGRNPVAVDAVGTAVMGFDATAKARQVPFPSSLNHIALAAEAGLGPNQLEQIEVRGLSIEQARFPFTATPNTSTDAGHALHMAMCEALDRRS